MTRKERFRNGVLAIALVAFAAAPAFAKTRSVSIAYPATLNGTPVAAGKYELTWQTHSPEATVTLADAKRVIATTDGRWEERNTKYERNAVVFETKSDGSRAIVEIRIAGLTGALVFGEPSK